MDGTLGEIEHECKEFRTHFFLFGEALANKVGHGGLGELLVAHLWLMFVGII